MRRALAGASVIVVALSTFVAAAPKKKKPKKKKPPPGTETDKGSGSGSGGEIEMDGGATTPTTTGTEPTAPVPDASASGSGSDANAVPGPTVPAGARPLAINDRPLTLGKGQFELHGALPIVVLPGLDAMNNKVSATGVAFAFGGTYGLDAKTELGADYAISLKPGDIKGPLTLHGAYTLKADKKFDFAFGGGFVIHPIGFSDPTTGNTTTNTFIALQLGAWFRYRATPKVSLFTGLPATPHPDISLSKAAVAFPPAPYQLTIGFNNSGAIAFALPIGVGIQAQPNVYLYAATELASIKLANTSNVFLFKDFIPITLGAYYSLVKLDIGAQFSDDLKQAGDYLAFTILARYYVK